jgi:hypothetical protein
MSVEMSVYTQQPAMSGSQLRELAGRRGLELRFLDLAGKPLGTTERLDVPLSGRDYVLIGWPAEHAETTAAVEQALGEGDKAAIDRLGMAGKLGWCQIGCGEFDFEGYQAALKEGLEEDEDEEPVPAEVLERMRRGPGPNTRFAAGLDRGSAPPCLSGWRARSGRRPTASTTSSTAVMITSRMADDSGRLRQGELGAESTLPGESLKTQRRRSATMRARKTRTKTIPTIDRAFLQEILAILLDAGTALLADPQGLAVVAGRLPDQFERSNLLVVDLGLDQEDELRAGVQRIAAILAESLVALSHGRSAFGGHPVVTPAHSTAGRMTMQVPPRRSWNLCGT